MCLSYSRPRDRKQDRRGGRPPTQYDGGIAGRDSPCQGSLCPHSPLQIAAPAAGPGKSSQKRERQNTTKRGRSFGSAGSIRPVTLASASAVLSSGHLWIAPSQI